MTGFNNCVVPPCRFFSIKRCVGYIFSFDVSVVFSNLFHEHALSYTGSLIQSTKASEHVMVQIGNTYKATAGLKNYVVQSFRFILCRLLVMYSLSLWVWSLLAN